MQKEFEWSTPKRYDYDTDGIGAFEEIEQMYEIGLIKGYPDGSFKPNNNISREHVAVILTRAFELKAKRNAKEY